jgi:PAS domain S-box-containing protein
MPPLSPEIFANVLELLPAGIYIVGLDRRIVFWNRAAEYITGYLAQEVLGRSCGDEILVHCGAEGTPVCSTTACLLNCALRDHKPAEAMLFARHKDGHRVPVRVKSIPIFNDSGRIQAIAEMFQQLAAGAELHWASRDCEPHDSLNIPSVLATEAYLQSRLKMNQTCAVFQIRVEDVQDLSKRRGLEMVYAMQRAMVHTASDLLSAPHFLGHWRGDGFVAIVPNSDESVFRESLQQLQGVSNACSVTWWGDRVTARAHVQGVVSKQGESVDCLLARLEQMGT